jgi:hypothetical protein
VRAGALDPHPQQAPASRPSSSLGSLIRAS